MGFFKKKEMTLKDDKQVELSIIRENTKGIVKYFNTEKGYGFIDDENGIDVFVHKENLHPNDIQKMNKGQIVTFDTAIVKNGNGKKFALNVRIASQTAASGALEQPPTDVMASFAKLLQANGVEHVVTGDDNTLCYRGYGSYLQIETTQLFSNARCAMTYLNKQWRANPFAVDDLGKIGIDIAAPFVITASTSLQVKFPDDAVRERTKQQIQALIAQEESFFRHIQCDDFLCFPYITISMGFDDPNMQTADQAFGFLQLFALAVHRIFGSITLPTGTPAPLPDSGVRYTPEATDANGGYFVYGPNGHVWWLVDSNFRFQSVVGAGVWQEFKDAEAEGLPLTATDMDNLYHYKDGIVYDSNNNLVGQYCSERIDRR